MRAAKRNAPEPQVGSRTVTFSDGVIKSAQEFRPLAIFDHVLRELAYVKVMDDEVVDLNYLAADGLCPHLFVLSRSSYHLPPDFSRQGTVGRRSCSISVLCATSCTPAAISFGQRLIGAFSDCIIDVPVRI